MRFRGREISVRERAGRRELHIDGVHIPTDYSTATNDYVAHHHIPNWAFDSLEDLAVALIDNRVRLRLDHHHHGHPGDAAAIDRAEPAMAAGSRVRRNQLYLSDSDRARFVAALKKMKEFRPPATESVYDKYVRWHLESMEPPVTRSPAHEGPAFLPWHREFLLRFENDLRAADQALGNDGEITIPYWDWTDPVSRGEGLARGGRIWQVDFMGGTGDPAQLFRVTTGPFSKDWPLTYSTGDLPFLTRRFGLDGFSLLSAAQDWSAARAAPKYDAAPWNRAAAGDVSFRNAFEGFQPQRQLHNMVHRWVGGSMVPSSSPNDPIFFLHHCNVDRLWALWQMQRGGQQPAYLPDPSAPDAADRGPADTGHNLDDPMPPWTTKPKDVLNHHMLGYSYDSDPPSIGQAGP